MELNQNKHVDRLLSYLPFSPTHDQLYEEFQKSEDSLNLDTVAFEFLGKAISKGSNLIILTGDAGHGKTHLCRRLLESHFDFSQDVARKLIKDDCDGSQVIKGTNGAKPLRIIKDFSEMNSSEASFRIEEAVNCVQETTIICANEGKLREALELSSEHQGSSNLLKRFNDSFSDGLASSDNKIHIINLNYQSIASGDQSLMMSAMKKWVSGTRWKTCKSCSSNRGCPIYFNRNEFSNEDTKNSLRNSKLNTLFSTVERLGYVVTFREMLMTLAYGLTTGLSCSNVHDKLSQRKKGWQHSYVFYNSLFTPPKELNSDKLSKISILNAFSQLDPGLISNGEIDDKLINEQGEFKEKCIDLGFIYRVDGQESHVDASKGIDDVSGTPDNNKDRIIEANFIAKVVRSLRRKYFFENKKNTTLQNLGFEYGDEFKEILNSEMSPTKMKVIKNLIIAGFHTIQGLKMGDKETNLHVVDPSFSSTTNNAAIIARRIPTNSIKLLSMQAAWSIPDSNKGNEIYTSVDWLDRFIVLRVNTSNDKSIDFIVNLMVFDCIARASSGYVAEEFYAHDLRRIKTFLSSLVKNQNAGDGDIDLFIKGKMHSVSIDNGVIQVGGGF